MNDTLEHLLRNGADGAPALAAPGRPTLTYGALRSLVAATIAALNGAGAGRNDRVAIVLDNGPEMAACFLACASGTTSAPLNPGYRADEFEFYLSDLNARLLVVARDSKSPAVEVAERLGVRIVDLIVDAGAPAGSFRLEPRAADAPHAAATNGGYSSTGDIALVLHTSGTTSRPKIVPLTQPNLCASAANIRAALALAPADGCLNIMPLFHIHGLIAGVLAPLSAGASVFCTPGFNALKFFALDGRGQADLVHGRADHAPGDPRARRRATPRSIARASAALHPLVVGVAAAAGDGGARGGLRRAGDRGLRHDRGGAPDGVQPAAAEGAQARLGRPGRGPRGRHHGRRRRAACRAGDTGEIVIRGANVTAGYENNPTANAEGFRNGWFRTGDQGVMDDDGYLSLTGRLKEIINRGGEKVEPARGRRGADGPPGGRAGGDLRHAARQARRGGRRGRRAARRRAASERELREFVGRPPGRLQGAARRSSSWPRSRRARPASSSASAWRKSSVSARSEDRGLRRRRDRRAARREARAGRRRRHLRRPRAAPRGDRGERPRLIARPGLEHHAASATAVGDAGASAPQDVVLRHRSRRTRCRRARAAHAPRSARRRCS